VARFQLPRGRSVMKEGVPLQYVHVPHGSDAHSGHGVKASWDERTVRHGNLDVLYLLTDAVVDTVCCGDRVFHYATVLGYVTDWKSTMTDSGQPVSSVQPVTDSAQSSFRMFWCDH
jgi:hypothetical protein